jgi:hypothetical protein
MGKPILTEAEMELSVGERRRIEKRRIRSMEIGMSYKEKRDFHKWYREEGNTLASRVKKLT